MWATWENKEDTGIIIKNNGFVQRSQELQIILQTHKRKPKKSSLVQSWVEKWIWFYEGYWCTVKEINLGIWRGSVDWSSWTNEAW